MNKPDSRRRARENEVVFRKANEKVQKDLLEVEKKAKSEGHGPTIDPDKLPLHFYCECSDEDCRKRIVMKLPTYKAIHRNRHHFVVIPGHEVGEIERIVTKEPKYYVVEKFILPDETVSELQETEVQNVSRG